MRRRRVVVSAALATVAVGAASLAVAFRAPSGGAIPRLPKLGPARSVYNGDFGDPFVLPVAQSGGRPTGYVLYGTDDPPDHIPLATSADLGSWARVGDAMPVLPSWAAPDPRDDRVWAPAVLRTPSKFLLYATVPDRASGRQCIAALVAAGPLGPFVDGRGTPLVCQAALGGSIDPSVVSDGRLHLVWKSDGNCCGQPAILWEQDLRDDGLAVTGQPHELLRADRPWQGGIVENPSLVAASAGGWWLFYSGNLFDVSAYATGLAYCPTLEGPCRETSDLPFLAGSSAPSAPGSPTQFSPGGLDVFRSLDGSLWAAYAVWNRPSRHGRFFCCRSVVFAPFLTN